MTMKTIPYFLLSAVSLLAAVAGAGAQESDRSVILQPKRGAISTGQVLRINFPDAMVEVGKHAAENNKVFAINLSAPFLVQFFKTQMDTVCYTVRTVRSIRLNSDTGSPLC